MSVSIFFQDRLNLLMNGQVQDAVVVGCDSRVETRIRGSSRQKVWRYAPIAVSEDEQKAVGTFYYDQEYCESMIAHSVPIYISSDEGVENRVGTFFQFWFFPLVLSAIGFAIFLSVLSVHLPALFLAGCFMCFAVVVADEWGVIDLPVVGLQKVAEPSPDGFVSGLSDVSVVSLRQCVAEAMEKNNLTHRHDVKRLICQDSRVSDLSSIADLVNLEELYLQGSALESLEDVPDFPNLRVLSVVGNESLKTLRGIEKFSNLEELQANGSAIEDLTGVEALATLRVVGLMRNQIRDVSVFKSLQNLEDVTLSYNQISDISPFSNKPNLVDFQFYANQVSDITPLYNNAQMKIVGVRGAGHVPCAQIDALRSRLSSDAKVYGQKVCD